MNRSTFLMDESPSFTAAFASGRRGFLLRLTRNGANKTPIKVTRPNLCRFERECGLIQPQKNQIILSNCSFVLFLNIFVDGVRVVCSQLDGFKQ